jgi:hypothetical protein
MGRTCAWCETVLHGAAAANRAVSHALCAGCLEELQAALAADRAAHSAEHESAAGAS